MRNLVFAHVDCMVSRDICSYLQIKQVPEMRLLPNDQLSFDGRSVDFEREENIDSYLNRYLNTFYDINGGLNKKYGRDDLLDDFAHEFMNAVSFL